MLEKRTGNNIISNPIENAEKLNMYITNTVAELVQQNVNKGSYNNSRQEINRCPNSIFIFPVTEENVVSLAKNLKDKPTASYDDIPKRLVKQCMQFNKRATDTLSLQSGVFPDEWKLAKVTPLYKKGSRYDIQNYIPVSIICLFATLLERLMFNKFITFIYKNKTLTET